MSSEVEQRKVFNGYKYILHIHTILPSFRTRGCSVYSMPLDVSPERYDAEHRWDYEHDQDNSLLRVDYAHLPRGGELILMLVNSAVRFALETRASLSVYPAHLRWKVRQGPQCTTSS